jgi:hypothetical protein
MHESIVNISSFLHMPQWVIILAGVAAVWDLFASIVGAEKSVICSLFNGILYSFPKEKEVPKAPAQPEIQTMAHLIAEQEEKRIKDLEQYIKTLQQEILGLQTQVNTLLKKTGSSKRIPLGAPSPSPANHAVAIHEIGKQAPVETIPTPKLGDIIRDEHSDKMKMFDGKTYINIFGAEGIGHSFPADGGGGGGAGAVGFLHTTSNPGGESFVAGTSMSLQDFLAGNHIATNKISKDQIQKTQPYLQGKTIRR